MLYLTMGNYGNKIGFGGTDEIVGGVGRSPLVFLFNWV